MKVKDVIDAILTKNYAPVQATIGIVCQNTKGETKSVDIIVEFKGNNSDEMEVVDCVEDELGLQIWNS